MLTHGTLSGFIDRSLTVADVVAPSQGHSPTFDDINNSRLKRISNLVSNSKSKSEVWEIQEILERSIGRSISHDPRGINTQRGETVMHHWGGILELDISSLMSRSIIHAQTICRNKKEGISTQNNKRYYYIERRV
jgi:hypothetical protein